MPGADSRVERILSPDVVRERHCFRAFRLDWSFSQAGPKEQPATIAICRAIGVPDNLLPSSGYAKGSYP